MAITNQERVGKTLDLLKEGLRPFVEREMLGALGEGWQQEAEQGFRGSFKGGINLGDVANLLGILLNEWNRVFEKTLGRSDRNTVHSLKEARNKWAHGQSFDSREVYRVMDDAALLLTAIAAPQAAEVEKAQDELQRTRYEDKRRNEVRKIATAALEGEPTGGLHPWREIVTPHPDVAAGQYRNAEFAADLWQVYQQAAGGEYQHPVEFFRRTFITDGLKQLLVGAIRRLGGKGGDPVVELQTNFGGGKTHSMLALYHLFGGTKAAELPGADALVKEAGVDVATSVRRAVLVGNRIAPGMEHKKPDGTVVRTLWGEMAWQLGGKEGFKMVQEDDKNATNPGATLTKLFDKYGPCLILIDEWIAYARGLHDGSKLPAGTFDTQFTFAQALTETIKAVPDALLVVSIPASDIEVGGQWGREALVRLKNITSRLQSTWRPASPEEGFEIVRRRLFQPIADARLFAARDATIRAYMNLYGQQQNEFPPECREMDYERRFKAAFPIHPELFDRLFNDWSTLERFQRTRGVLRLMAAVIHCLWERNDQSLAIMPAHVSIDDPNVQGELTRYLEDNWPPVISKDVDGPHSLPLTLDRENPNFGKYSAARRVARTIYLGSAPLQSATNRGIDDRRIRLGCVQPGESTATFGDALRRLADKATYLYADGSRYWYSTQPTVTRLAEDRAAQLNEHDVIDEVTRRLRKEAQHRGGFSKVHVCVSSGDVIDDREARLVIMGPEYPHTKNQADSPARTEARAMLEMRGSSPRIYRNTLAFLAADASRLDDLLAAARQYLAWTSIWDEREQLELGNFQTRQAENRRNNADETVKARIPETYQWLLVPVQSDPKSQPDWEEMRQQGQDSLAARAAKKLVNEDLLTSQLGGTRLRMELDRVPLWRGDGEAKNDVSVKQLMDDFATYLYLPRLTSPEVLIAAIRDGLERLTWPSETFAYAQGKDEETGRYVGLRAGGPTQVIADGRSLVVKADVAKAQMDADAAAAASVAVSKPTPSAAPGSAVGAATLPGVTPSATAEPSEPAKPVYRRFHGNVELDTQRVGVKAGDVAREVIQHLATLPMANVKVTLEIEADLPGGTPDDVIRTVSENCRTLRFENHGFEES